MCSPPKIRVSPCPGPSTSRQESPRTSSCSAPLAYSSRQPSKPPVTMTTGGGSMTLDGMSSQPLNAEPSNGIWTCSHLGVARRPAAPKVSISFRYIRRFCVSVSASGTCPARQHADANRYHWCAVWVCPSASARFARSRSSGVHRARIAPGQAQPTRNYLRTPRDRGRQRSPLTSSCVTQEVRQAKKSTARP